MPGLLKLFLYAFIILTGTMGVFMLLTKVPENEPGKWTIYIGVSVAFFVLLVLVFYLNDLIVSRYIDWQSKKYMRNLEENGLLVTEDYQARRAFQIEEWEDEGPHYVIELIDGSVLYLNGQYLDEYEPIEIDPDFNQPRRFPCTSFTARRHKTEGFVFDLTVHGQVLDPECLTSLFYERNFKPKIDFMDGQLITDQNYDQIKSVMTNQGRTHI